MKNSFLLLSLYLCICICSSLHGAEPSQKIEEEVKRILSQEFFDTVLSKHRDEIRQYTRAVVPDLFNATVQEQENGCLYKLSGVFDLYKATDNPDKPMMYPIYWLNVAQFLAEKIEDGDKREKAEELVHAHATAHLVKMRLEQIKVQEEEIEKERVFFEKVIGLLNEKGEDEK